MTLYEKRGRRYFPVQDTLALDGLTNGTWLIHVKDGCREYYGLAPVQQALKAIAAMPQLAEWIRDALQEWTQLQPPRKMTLLEQRAWKAYCDVLGEEATLTLTRPAAYDVARGVAGRIVEGLTNGKV